MARKKATPPVDTSETDLNLKRELFCRYYTQNDATFGNATLSYAEAYGYDFDALSDEGTYEDGVKVKASTRELAENVCAVQGRKLLRNTHVQSRMTVLLNELLTDEIVDSQLAKVVMQDLKPEAKVAAIREYNKVKGRIIDKSQITRVEKLDLDDVRQLISVLPQERQDQFYATITDILAEAELRRSSANSEGSSPQ